VNVLPPSPSLPTERIARTHTPRTKSFPSFRECLRWEFGFSCAFCSLHEADVNELDLEGLGFMSIEHKEPQSRDSDQVHRYTNCFYCCKLCNRSRSDRPSNDTMGRELLDPCHDIWSSNFTYEDDSFRPTSDNGALTQEAYDLNDARKIRLRRHRRGLLEDALRVIRDYPALLREAVETAATADSSGQLFLSSIARSIREQIQRAIGDLERFRAVPDSAPDRCACRSATRCALPVHLQKQLIEVMLPRQYGCPGQ
jgi:hypothetical protein